MRHTSLSTRQMGLQIIVRTPSDEHVLMSTRSCDTDPQSIQIHDLTQYPPLIALRINMQVNLHNIKEFAFELASNLIPCVIITQMRIER